MYWYLTFPLSYRGIEADRAEITGAIVDGPLAFDNAVSIESAREKNIRVL
ncbi:hypothetical protein LEAN103870_07735 [Legionella anisa]|nr:hypothetical protein [Legionella anisa]MCW8425385.1 hypothetical protein [Legionella anisa]MCW8449184.1 hypothetical protein [Legionella anisa]UAK79655.1 hypothetical protein K8O89_00720 [Legionella anisa]